MKYQTGESILAGDQILIEDGRTPGQILEVIEAEQHMKNWNVEEPGVMIESAPFGLVFWPLSDTDPVVFVARREQI